jgi:hypothetical protein
VLAGKLKQQAAQWASLHKKTTALTAELMADELRYEVSASETFSGLREQGNGIGRAMKMLQRGLDDASNMVYAQLPPLELARGVEGDGSNDEQEEAFAAPAEGQLGSSAAAAAGTDASSGDSAASTASVKAVSGSDATLAALDADPAASGPAGEATTTDATVVVAAAGTHASSTAGKEQVTTAEELSTCFEQLTLSQGAGSTANADAALDSIAGLETRADQQCSNAADGEAAESTDSLPGTSFSIGRLFRMAVTAAAGTK